MCPTVSDTADHLITARALMAEQKEDEVPDVEDVTPQAISRTQTGESVPPVPQDSKYTIPRKPISSHSVPLLGHLHLPASETVSKTFVAVDGVSEYVMTVSVSRMYWCSHGWLHIGFTC